MKKSKKLTCLLLASLMGASTMSACFGGGSSKDEVKFWVYGSLEQVNAYTLMTEEFNRTYGKDHGITVEIAMKPKDSYASTIQIFANSSSGPDVFLVEDDPFKSWVIGGYMSPIDSYLDAITDIETGEIRATVKNKLRYDKTTNTSNADDPLYGLPLNSMPTALYYNKSLLEKAGIFVISVDEENLDAWNAGTIADNNGVYKRDMENVNGLTLDGVTVPAKGYYRQYDPYYYVGEDTKEWLKPTTDEVLVFNNRIAMNWDEVEDLSMIFTAHCNPKDNNPNNTVTEYGTTYGYFTEWWFNYGWSVGGDCLLDLTGEGEWNFSLLDPNPNYVVMNGTYTGERTGKVYQVGETLEFRDKMDMATNETLVPDAEGGYKHSDGTEATVDADVVAAKNSGTLAQMPSTRDAFKRYLKLGANHKTNNIEGEAGLNISPNPNTFTGAVTSMSYFFSGNIALLAQTSVWLYELDAQADAYHFEWDVAPLVTYKEYEDPSDPDCDTVVAQGKDSGHSNSYSMAVRTASEKKDKAAAFIKWMAGLEGQKVLAEHGFFPNQDSLVDDITFAEGVAPGNVKAFSEALEYQGPGDWWYMPDVLWVQAWCVDLNSYVRNGTMTWAQWYKDAISATNNKLKEYQRYER